MKDLFSLPNAPYYIATPPYSEDSGGIRAMHYLCHALNLAGEEAYVLTDTVAPRLRTPCLTNEKKKAHRKANREPIVVYPEVVPDNPQEAVNVVRYLLNIPGHINDEPVRWSATDLIYTHGPDLVPEGIEVKLLRIPLINASIYNSQGTDPSKRKGRLVFINRYLSFGGQLLPITEGATEISFRVPRRTPEQLRDLYRQAELLYTYEHSTACYEAMLCGCPVVYIPNDITLKTPPNGPSGYLGQDGWSWGPDPAGIEVAKASVHRTIAAYESSQEIFWQELAAFVDDTQSLARKNAGVRSSPAKPTPGLSTDDEIYRYWMSLRSFIETDVCFLEMGVSGEQQASISYHILARLPSGSASLLADTLDSLNQQFYTNWHLDVLSDMPAPSGIDEIPCIEWHCLNNIQDSKDFTDTLVKARKATWVIEIPAGIQLDSLYLWRLAKESVSAPDTCAFFVDDDCHDVKGNRHSPRFKPGVNPAALQSSDLSGPICVRREAWLDSGGGSSRIGSPWFLKLLQLANRFGWGAVKHIPDVLLSYPDKSPSDVESCLVALVESQMREGIASEIVPVTSQSWNIRYPLSTTPTITIAILSQGQRDYLPRCFDSIIGKTDYPHLEIIIALTYADDDPDLNDWLGTVTQRPSPKIHIVRTSPTANHATRCNAAVQASSNDFVLLIREEAVVIQEKWLEELVRTCQQPDVAATAPCLIAPGTSQIQEAGSVLGLTGLVGSPYQGEAKVGDLGYLNILRIARDTSSLAGACLLIRTADYLAVGGMDETDLGDHLADADLCQRLRGTGQRLIYQPQATVVYGGPTNLGVLDSLAKRSRDLEDKLHAEKVFAQRWLTQAGGDPFWNSNLSLASRIPTPETYCAAQWQYLPAHKPRILTRYLTNGQGLIRITAALRACRKAGLATECLIPQENDDRELSASEILRLAPDSVIVQHYISDGKIAGLEDWQVLPNRPFTVYALDDLLTNFAETNQFRKIMPANGWARLQYALKRCDRLVVSTDFLAHECRHLISDIRVVPNRMEQELWLHLRSKKRVGNKPRIGWAGGTTHQGDLILLKEVIEQTRHEADWIFFGMCPKEIRPLVAEYHALGTYAEYPARLAALNLDIAVAPLAQIPFNQAKSNLRLLEYGILGIPVVCTDIDPYQNSPACRVANTVEAWTNALRERIYDADAREREGFELRQWVLQSYLIENYLDEWLAAHLPG